jgi:hypothetical protein
MNEQERILLKFKFHNLRFFYIVFKLLNIYEWIYLGLILCIAPLVTSTTYRCQSGSIVILLILPKFDQNSISLILEKFKVIKILDY